MNKIRPLAAMALVLASVSMAAAEVSLKEISWGFRKGAKVSVHPVFERSEQWIQPPAGKILVAPRVAVTLINRDPAPAQGVVLRYAINARIVNIKTPKDRGTWVVPIWVDERRVPLLKPNQILDNIQLDPSPQMRLALFKMYRAGFWPNALNIQVMVEPRYGEDLTQKILEKALPVVWQSTGK